MMWLLALVDPISRIVGKIADAKVEHAKAQTDQERVAAEERVRTLQARRDVLVAESGNRLNAWMRLGPITGGSTDALDDNLWKVVAAVIGFYFLYEASRFLARRG
jgi:hypothetical protein